MKTNKVLNIACEAGRIILQNGGETYRVEETMIKICNSYGLINADSFATPTCIILSATDSKGDTVSCVKRINYRTIDLEKVSLVNDLSRNILHKKLSLEYVNSKLIEINKLQKYSNKTSIFFSSLLDGCFTTLFGGTIKDFLISFIIGGVIKFVSIILSRIKTNEFFINIIGGALSALIALTCVKLGIGNNLDKIIIGSIMLLVPGLALTNAIRDTIAGDLISGLSRLLESIFIAVAVAVGVGIVMKIWITLEVV